MILLVGCVASLDKEVCNRIRSAGQRVRALVPPGSGPGRTAALRQAGAEVLEGDAHHPATLAAACQGVDSVIMTMAPAPGWGAENGHVPDRECSRALVELAYVLGVHRFVAVTVPKGFQKDSPLLQATNELCDRLMRHGMDHTILGANFIMEAWLTPAQGFDYGNGRAVVFGDGNKPAAWISARDVADLVWSCISSANRVRHIDVGGPENLTQLDVVRTFEEVSGREMEVQHVDLATLQREYESARTPEARAIAGMKWQCAMGCAMGGASTSAARITIRDYAAQVLNRRTAAGGTNYSPD